MYFGERGNVHRGDAVPPAGELRRSHVVLCVVPHPDALYFGFVELGRLEVPFGRPEQCKTVAEQLAYSMKYMNQLNECPKEFEDRLFPLLFRASAYANMNVKQQQEVTHIMRTELDRIAENEYARKQGEAAGIKKGREEGRKDERKAMAQKMKENGIDKETIFAITGIRI